MKNCIDQNYVMISSSDLIRCMIDNKQDERVYNECKNILLNYDLEDNYFKLPTFHPVVLLLNKKREDPYYIDANILKEALAVSISENNYEMQKKITRCFRKYMCNERNGFSNAELIREILIDDELMNFIKKHQDFNVYEQELVTKSYVNLQKQIRLSKERQIKGQAIL